MHIVPTLLLIIYGIIYAFQFVACGRVATTGMRTPMWYWWSGYGSRGWLTHRIIQNKSDEARAAIFGANSEVLKYGYVYITRDAVLTTEGTLSEVRKFSFGQ